MRRGSSGYWIVRDLGAQLIYPGGDVRAMSLGLRELIKTFAEPAVAAEANGAQRDTTLLPDAATMPPKGNR